jgi:hypothetical protein
MVEVLLCSMVAFPEECLYEVVSLSQPTKHCPGFDTASPRRSHKPWNSGAEIDPSCAKHPTPHVARTCPPPHQDACPMCFYVLRNTMTGTRVLVGPHHIRNVLQDVF